MRRLYLRLIKPGQLCFDIGAHRGDRVRLLRAAGARVVAVEPQPDLVDQLRKNYPDVTVVSKAVSEKEGHLTLHLNNEDSTLASLSDQWTAGRFAGKGWGADISVPVTTLDRLIEEYGVPSFVKVDVEGHEPSVFRGLSEPLPLVSFEFIQENADDALFCLDRLAELGPVQANLSLGQTGKLHFAGWTTPEQVRAEIDRLRAGNMHLWGDIYVCSPLLKKSSQVSSPVRK